jgi:NAD(P)H-nitrite reductase large subunit
MGRSALIRSAAGLNGALILWWVVHNACMWDFRKVGTRICVCFDVTNTQALETWHEQPNVGALTARYSCGTNCGMCIPYFNDLLAEWQQGKWPTQETQHGEEVLVDEG